MVVASIEKLYFRELIIVVGEEMSEEKLASFLKTGKECSVLRYALPPSIYNVSEDKGDYHGCYC